MRTFVAAACCLAVSSVAWAQKPSAQVQPFVKVDTPLVALTHVRVIDGTGAAARDDQTLVLANGKIQSVSAARIRPGLTTAPPGPPQTVGLDRELDDPIVEFFSALEIKTRLAGVHTIKLVLQRDSLPRNAKTLISGGLVEPLRDLVLGERPFVVLPTGNGVLFEFLIESQR